ncbi:MAG: OmpA family protein [Bacteroidia bacterium]|nr:OmpA family protein [Bacteroidia bacterium]
MKNWQLKGYGKDAERIGDYYSAINYYNEFLKRKPNNFHYTLLRLAYLYKKNRDYENAKITFNKAYLQSSKKNMEALFNYALMLKSLGEYDEALLQFKICDKETKKGGNRSIEKWMIKNEISGISLAHTKTDSFENKKIIHLDTAINKANIEFSPIILNDTTLVYGSAESGSTEYYYMKNKEDMKFRKFFLAVKNNNFSWNKSNALPPPFENTDSANTGTGCFSPDRDRFYFTRCKENRAYKTICDLYVKEFSRGKWGQALKADNRINHPDYTTTQPAVGSCYMENLDVVYFISDRPGGMGGFDIWYTVYNKTIKEYTKAVNAGAFINTPGDEKTPFYDMAAHALYFSSNGWPAFGGFDIFRSFGDLVNWSKPENTGSPVNSSFDDLCYTVSPDHLYGFFTSNRTGSVYLNHKNCCDDIYSFYQVKNENISLSAKIIPKIITREFLKIPEENRDTILLSNYLDGAIASLYLSEPNMEPIFLARNSIEKGGDLSFSLMRNKDYKIIIEDKRLVENSFSLSTYNNTSSVLKFDSVPIEIIPEKPIILRNILYDFDVATLCDSAKKYIDTTLIPLLQKYPGIHVEIYSHTDSKGGESYNLNLSQKRAENVLRYLAEKGIEKDRLAAIGSGQNFPIAKNTNDDGSDNPEGRKLNRRTELKIIKK